MDTWRLITDPPLDGAENMASDEAVLRCALGRGELRPTLRLYSWRRPTVTVGYLQSSAPYARCGLPVVRRITGGRAVLHDMELTYSVVAGPETPLFAGGIPRAYAIISRCIMAALKDAGVPAELVPVDRPRRFEKTGARDRGACFHTPSRCEVLAGGKKLVGSAQRRFKDVFLQHGSILLGIDAELNSSVFGPGLLENMTSVKEYGDADPERLKGLLVKRFSEGLSCSFLEQGLTQRELAVKGGLVRDRYSRDEWNLLAERPGALEGAAEPAAPAP